MSLRPHQSLPKQCPGWADLKAAYRLLSNPQVKPQAIQEPHRRHVHALCGRHTVVLCVQDTSDLDFTNRIGVKNLGKTGNGSGRGILQHTALAVLPDTGAVLGVLHQDWHARVEQPAGETRRQRQSRWRESQVWADTIREVGPGPQGCRLIHVGDRHSDVWETFDAADAAGVGFVVRAMHDRRIEHAGNAERDVALLWPTLQARTVQAELKVAVGEQRNGRGAVKRLAREATVSVRFGPVTLALPNHRRPAGAAPRSLWAIYVLEENPPAGVEALEWMLLSSEPLADAADALRLVGYYQKRWVIEEFHRVEKEGCGLELSQLDDAADIARLAAVVAVLAIRLLQLRDLARCTDPASDTPAALAAVAPASWIVVVAKLAKVQSTALTPSLFWRTLARQGGHIGRKRDGPPGWKTLWRGVYDVQLLVEGYEMKDQRRSCG
jgi:hypothetical protein